MTAFLANTLDLYLDAAPWLLLGLLAAAALKLWVSETALARWLGGAGMGAVTKAAFIGAPLPLCSCGVLPAAVGLRRGGASKPATVSFLVATPETGPDSVAVSYALLGPFMAVARLVAAVASAIFTGLLAALVDRKDTPSPLAEEGCRNGPCCCGDGAETRAEKHAAGRARAALRFAFVEVADDIALWLLVGLALAGLAVTLVPPMALADWGRGPGAMLVMLAAGLPIYVCATASTPIAAALLALGVSPGAVLVFLLAGPATNLASIGVVGRVLGRRVLVAYLGGIAVSSLALGWVADALFAAGGFEIVAEIGHADRLVPGWLEIAAGLVMAPLLVAALARAVVPWAARKFSAAA